MGLSISWLAVAQRPVQEILNRYALVDSGVEAVPGSCAVTGALLPNGWYVVVFDEFWHPFVQPDEVEILSDEGTVVVCAEYEGTNTSVASLYRNCEQLWQVSHVEEQDHLEIEGTPPPATQQLLSEAIRKGREEEYDAVFSVPAALAQQVCGYRFGELGGVRFTELLPKKILDGKLAIASVLARLMPLLAGQGFRKQKSGENFVRYAAASGEDELLCYFHHGMYPRDGAFASMAFEAHNTQVARIVEQVLGQNAVKPTCVRGLRGLVLPRLLQTKEHVAEWLAQVEPAIPPLIDQMRTIRGLDALVNDGTPRTGITGAPIEGHWDMGTGWSGVVLAWLAGNPDFERMVTATHAFQSRSHPNDSALRLAAHLRANVKPVARED